MTDPAISVVMSVYNGEAYLAEAVESILNQTFRDFEFIIIDDGSTDKTPEMLAGYSGRDPRIRIITQENKGRATSLNIGIEAARSKYIARMDADDISLPNRFQQQLEFLKRHPEVGLLGGAVELIQGTGRSLEKVQVPTSDSELRSIMLEGNPMWHPTIMMRKESVVTAGGYRKQLLDTDDYDLWLRMIERCEIANLSACILRYRVHANQVSVRNIEHQTVCVAAARAAAALRRDGRPDPLSSLPGITQSIIRDLGIGRDEMHQRLVGTCLYWLRLFKKADDEAALEPIRALLLLSKSAFVGRSILSDAWLTAARIHYKKGKHALAVFAAVRAFLVRPVVVGRPVKKALLRLANIFAP